MGPASSLRIIPHVPSRWLHVSAVCSFGLLSIPCCATCHLCLSVSPAEGHLSHSKFSVIMNGVAINIHCRFVWRFSRYSRVNTQGIGLLGCMESMFNFKRNCQTILSECPHHPCLPPATLRAFTASADMTALGIAGTLF